MIHASSLDGLTPVKQQIAERAMEHFADSFVLALGPRGCTHSFDLAVPRSPARLVPGVAPAGLLFFGAGGCARPHRAAHRADGRAGRRPDGDRSRRQL
jgi:hypothetical protein